MCSMIVVVTERTIIADRSWTRTVSRSCRSFLPWRSANGLTHSTNYGIQTLFVAFIADTLCFWSAISEATYNTQHTSEPSNNHMESNHLVIEGNGANGIDGKDGQSFSGHAPSGHHGIAYTF